MHTNAWKRTTVGEIFQVVGGGTPSTKRQEFWSGKIPWITSADIDACHRVEPRRWITKEAIDNSATHLVPAGSIIVVTRVGLGKVAIAPTDLAFSQDSQALLPANDKIDPKFAVLQLSQRVQSFKHISRGTTINGVTKKQLLDVELELPPLEEQRRIVSEIEKQFTRLDAGTASLKGVQTALKRYRASVLKAACEGRLVPTEAELARKENRSYETGEELLQRVLKERREKWNGKGKYKQPTIVSATGPCSLPVGWTWATAGELFDCIVPNRDKPKTFTGEIPWITLPDFSERTRITRTSSGLGLTESEVRKYNARLIPAGSVVMSCIGRFGLAAVLDRDAVINQQLHAFLIPNFLPAEYFVYAFRSQKSFMENVATSTTIAYLNKTNCNSVPIPLPPLAEQTRIVTEVERRLSIIEELEGVVSANQHRAVPLRQSVLKQAFSGRLCRGQRL